MQVLLLGSFKNNLSPRLQGWLREVETSLLRYRDQLGDFLQVSVGFFESQASGLLQAVLAWIFAFLHIFLSSGLNYVQLHVISLWKRHNWEVFNRSVEFPFLQFFSLLLNNYFFLTEQKDVASKISYPICSEVHQQFLFPNRTFVESCVMRIGVQGEATCTMKSLDAWEVFYLIYCPWQIQKCFLLILLVYQK